MMKRTGIGSGPNKQGMMRRIEIELTVSRPNTMKRTGISSGQSKPDTMQRIRLKDVPNLGKYKENV